jgi:hypothetical protein
MSKQLARPRPDRGSDPDRTKVVFVRQPVKQLARETDQDNLLRYVFVTCSLAIALTAVLAALGGIGSTLGFEDGLGLPRRTSNVMSSLVDGISTVSAMPLSILRAGEDAILLPLLGPLWVGIPAALLTLARPRVPGAPLPAAGSRALAATGAVFAGLVSVGGVIWVISNWRGDIISSFPLDASGYSSWREQLDLVSGIDVFVFLALVLWSVLGFRLGLPRWGRALVCVALLAASTTVFVAMSTSTGIVHGLDSSRPMVEGGGGLLVGNVGDVPLLVEVESDRLRVSMASAPLEFSGSSTLGEQLAGAVPGQVDGPRP